MNEEKKRYKIVEAIIEEIEQSGISVEYLSVKMPDAKGPIIMFGENAQDPYLTIGKLMKVICKISISLGLDISEMIKILADIYNEEYRSVNKSKLERLNEGE